MEEKPSVGRGLGDLYNTDAGDDSVVSNRLPAWAAYTLVPGDCDRLFSMRS